MLNFDSLTLKFFNEEISNFFEGAKIQKIQQPSRYELIFYIRNKGETKKFYININPNFYHICFLNEKNEKLRNFKIPKTAPMFCMLLRKYIQNTKIIKVEVPKYERIFEIYFEYFDELNEKSKLCLAIELMGKYSNVILYNYDTNIIIGCAHNVSAQKSRERELYGSLPYMYPVKRRKKNLLKTDFETFKNIIDLNNIPNSVSSQFYYLTTVLVQDTFDLFPDLKMFYNKLVEILNEKKAIPVIKNDFSKYYTTKFPDTFECKSVNEMIDSYFSFYQHKFIVNQFKLKIDKIINVRLNKLNNLKIKQELQLKKKDEAQEYKNKADILSANLYGIKKVEDVINLEDFNGEKIEIELDCNKTITENIEKYYNLYKKAKTSYEYALSGLNETNSEILYFEEMKYFSENTKEIEELESLEEELTNEGESKVSQTAQNVDMIEIDGYKIYAGKNKKQNDYILSKLSSPEDLWFHPLNAAGAHIIVKTNKGTVPDNVILKAAQITKDYSSQKNNSKTSIIYTKRKYVKKATKKKAFVTYKNEVEIVV